MSKNYLTRLFAALIAVERGHQIARAFIPQYDAIINNTTKNIKRKLGLRKTLWDSYAQFLGTENITAIFQTLKDENSHFNNIEYFLAEQATISNREAALPEGAYQFLSTSVSFTDLKNVLLDNDVSTMFLEVPTQEQLNGLVIDVCPYVMGDTVRKMDKEKLKTADPAVEIVSQMRKRIGGWGDVIYLKYDGIPFIVIRGVLVHKNQGYNSLFDRNTTVAQNPTSVEAEPRYIFLFENKPEIKQIFSKKIELNLSPDNKYKGCIAKIDLRSHDRSLSCDTQESAKMRFLQREIDMMVYPEVVRKSVASDVMQFVNRSLIQQSERLDIRRSYLFVGPPGCGKTKLISCIIGVLPLDMTVLIITRDTIGMLPNIGIDFPTVKPLAVIIEDIDIMVSRSGERQILMNFLDGLFSEQKMITIMTANNPKILGNSFIKRPGRIDRIIEIVPGDIEVRAAQIGKFLHNRKSEMTAHDIAALTEGFSFAQHREAINRAALYSSSDEVLETDAINKAVEECKSQFLTGNNDESYVDYDDDYFEIDPYAPKGDGLARLFGADKAISIDFSKKSEADSFLGGLKSFINGGEKR